MLRDEIESAINRHSAERASDTPDYILAEFLIGCLTAFDAATRERDRWYGRTGLTNAAGKEDIGCPQSRSTTRASEDDANIDNVFAELVNIIRNGPVFPGDTISHRTANECVRRGWAKRDPSGYFESTAGGEMIADMYGLMGDD